MPRLTLFAFAVITSVPASGQLAAIPVWNLQTPRSPDERAFARMAYRESENAVYLWGGEAPDGSFPTTIWRQTLHHWIDIPTGPTPIGRASHAMAWDDFRDELVVFGGEGDLGSIFDDTWTFDGATWTEHTGGTTPAARYNASMAYDAARLNTVLFGGQAPFQLFGETWIWTTEWNQVTPTTNPPDRHSPAMAYDPRRREVVMFGGTTGSQALDDTWVWNGTDWTQRFPANMPPARHAAQMDYVDELGGIVLIGGTSDPSTDSWLWNGVDWFQLPIQGPEVGRQHAAAYKRNEAYFVVRGGLPPSDNNWEWRLTTTDVETLYVDAAATGNGNALNWRDAATNLRSALNVAQPGQAVLVAQGTYKPDPVDRHATFEVPSGVSLIGSYTGGQGADQNERDPSCTPSILDGDLNGDDLDPETAPLGVFENRNDNSYQILHVLGPTVSIVSGFIIQNGEADGSGEMRSGGGARWSGTGTVTDCVFRRNRADNTGGAIACFANILSLIRCQFDDNHAGGSGGAFYSGFASASNNFYNCRFMGNAAGSHGGAIGSNANTDIINGVFSGNSAGGEGGAVSIVFDTLTVHSSTIYGNTAQTTGGLRIGALSRLNLYNSILWANTDSTGASIRDQQYALGTAATVSNLKNTTIEQTDETFPGFEDPRGRDSVLGTPDDDLRLELTSGLIGFADEADLPSDIFDLDGDGDNSEPLPIDALGGTRVVDNGVTSVFLMDRGAYERCGYGIFIYEKPPATIETFHARRLILDVNLDVDGVATQYVWTRNGIPITPDDRVSVFASGALIIDPVLVTDAAQYRAFPFYETDGDCPTDTSSLPSFTITQVNVTVSGDFDGDGDTDIADLLAFLNPWFASNELADLDGTGSITVADLLIYLGLYFDAQ